MMINRRKLITGLISFIAAPAIVRASNLMPVKVMDSFDPKEVFNELRNKLLNYEYTGYVPAPIRLFWLSPKGLKIMPIEQSDLYLESLNDLS